MKFEHSKRITFNIKGYDIHFILKPCRKDVSHLVVLLNGYRHYGWDFENSINFFKCHVLMIEDIFDLRQSCYLGSNQSFVFSDIVAELIEIVLSRLSLEKDDCTLIGPSKGGFAALYIGLKYNFKNIVAPSFVGNIGRWMVDYNKDIAHHVMGNYDEAIVSNYDNLLIELIKTDSFTDKNIYVFVSDNDHFYLKYGQQDVIDELEKKYSNLSVFFTSSPLAFQHDQVASYFLQEILSITYLLTQNIHISVGSDNRNDQSIKIVLPNNKIGSRLLSLKKNSLNVEKPKNKIKKIALEGDKVFIEGLVYIENFDSPNYKYLFKYLLFKNVDSSSEMEVVLGTIPKGEVSRTLFKDIYIDYTAATTATMGFKGISLQSLVCGTYILMISVSKESKARVYLDINLDDNLDIRSIDNSFEYRIYTINKKAYLTKKDILGRTTGYLSYFSLEKFWVKDFIFHIEGVFIVPGVDMNEFHMGRYYLIIKNKENEIQYSFPLGQMKREGLNRLVNNPYDGYRACYYATMGLEGINTSNFEKGRYDLYISLSYKSEIFSQLLNKILLIEDDKCLLSN